jgi:hypothetical protein
MTEELTVRLAEELRVGVTSDQGAGLYAGSVAGPADALRAGLELSWG